MWPWWCLPTPTLPQRLGIVSRADQREPVGAASWVLNRLEVGPFGIRGDVGPEPNVGVDRGLDSSQFGRYAGCVADRSCAVVPDSFPSAAVAVALVLRDGVWPQFGHDRLAPRSSAIWS